MSELIESGTYGDVYYINPETVVKQSNLYIEDEGYNTPMLRELILLTQYRNFGLVNLNSFNIKNNKLELYLPHLNFTLTDFISTFEDSFDSEEFEPDEFVEFVRDQKIEFLYKLIYKISETLIFLHGNCIIHNDLKPDNIMVDANENIKLIDLGSALICKADISFCTTEYRSPEAFLGNGTCYASDIWSLGLVCLFVANNYNLISNINIGNDYNPASIDLKIKEYLFKDNPVVLSFKTGNLHKYPDLVNVISRMLTFDPKLRITALELYCDVMFCKFDRSLKSILVHKFDDVCSPVMNENRGKAISIIFNLCKKYPRSISLAVLILDRYSCIKTCGDYNLVAVGCFILANALMYSDMILIEWVKGCIGGKCRIKLISSTITDILTVLGGSIYRKCLMSDDYDKIVKFYRGLAVSGKTQDMIIEEFGNFESI